MSLRVKRALCLTAIAVGMFNFFAYLAISDNLGGDALNGRSANGHYFLASGRKETQVSHSVLVYSKVHTLSLFVTHPLAIAGGLVLFATFRREASCYDSKSA